MAARARSLLAVALLLSSVAGCNRVSFARGTVSTRRLEAGAPLVDPGPDAYSVWSDVSGWHLRVRSDVVRRFEGQIRGAGGAVALVHLREDAVERRGDLLRFSFASRGEAGIDWKDGRCVELALFVDGDDRPLRSFVGAFGALPARTPQRICR